MIALLVVLVAGGLMVVWSFNGHGFETASFDRILPGMTKEEVKSIAGEPSFTHASGEVGNLWFYNRRFKICRGIVYFGRGDIVASKFHDH